MGYAQAVFKAVVRGAREYIVRDAQLLETSESLELGGVYDADCFWGEGHRTVDGVVDDLAFLLGVVVVVDVGGREGRRGVCCV